MSQEINHLNQEPPPSPETVAVLDALARVNDPRTIFRPIIGEGGVKGNYSAVKLYHSEVIEGLLHITEDLGDIEKLNIQGAKEDIFALRIKTAGEKEIALRIDSQGLWASSAGPYDKPLPSQDAYPILYKLTTLCFPELGKNIQTDPNSASSHLYYDLNMTLVQALAATRNIKLTPTTPLDMANKLTEQLPAVNLISPEQPLVALTPTVPTENMPLVVIAPPTDIVPTVQQPVSEVENSPSFKDFLADIENVRVALFSADTVWDPPLTDPDQARDGYYRLSVKGHKIDEIGLRADRIQDPQNPLNDYMALTIFHENPQNNTRIILVVNLQSFNHNLVAYAPKYLPTITPSLPKDRLVIINSDGNPRGVSSQIPPDYGTRGTIFANLLQIGRRAVEIAQTNTKLSQKSEIPEPNYRPYLTIGGTFF